MSGLTPLLDTLLATRLAQRLDLLPLKGQFDLAGTGPAPAVAQVGNDVRLASREALQQQLGVLEPVGSRIDAGALQNRPGESINLSAAARALSTVLEAPVASGSRVLGLVALWPDAQAPDTPQLAATLARTVSGSGLFYEAHLQQFAQGERSLAQMAQEPQARLGASEAVALKTEALEPSRLSTPGSAATPAEPANAALHPGTVALVRQQLELLTQPQFRWSGEAWPGAPLDWDIEQEQEASARGAEPDATAQRWTTRLALALPALGALEARLSIVGNTLELRLAARETATGSLLKQAGAELPGRLAAQGLQLTGLQVVPLAAQTAAP